MKKRCKNCAYRTHTIEGDAWCNQRLICVNDDGCCRDHKVRYPILASSIIALTIALVALAIILIPKIG